MSKTNTTNNITINNVQEYKGNIYRVITCKATIDGTKTNITYNRDNGDVVINEWYKLDKAAIKSLTAEIRNRFKAA